MMHGLHQVYLTPGHRLCVCQALCTAGDTICTEAPSHVGWCDRSSVAQRSSGSYIYPLHGRQVTCFTR